MANDGDHHSPCAIHHNNQTHCNRVPLVVVPSPYHLHELGTTQYAAIHTRTRMYVCNTERTAQQGCKREREKNGHYYHHEQQYTTISTITTTTTTTTHAKYVPGRTMTTTVESGAASPRRGSTTTGRERVVAAKGKRRGSRSDKKNLPLARKPNAALSSQDFATPSVMATQNTLSG
jgi:hypothetical protein